MHNTAIVRVTKQRSSPRELEDIDFSNEENVEDGFFAVETEENEMRRRGGGEDDGDERDERPLSRAMPAERGFGDPHVARPLEVAVGNAGARALGLVDVDLLEFFDKRTATRAATRLPVALRCPSWRRTTTRTATSGCGRSRRTSSGASSDCAR